MTVRVITSCGSVLPVAHVGSGLLVRAMACMTCGSRLSYQHESRVAVHTCHHLRSRIGKNWQQHTRPGTQQAWQPCAVVRTRMGLVRSCAQLAAASEDPSQQKPETLQCASSVSRSTTVNASSFHVHTAGSKAVSSIRVLAMTAPEAGRPPIHVHMQHHVPLLSPPQHSLQTSHSGIHVLWVQADKVGLGATLCCL